jgi:hypothetical protein
MTKLNLAFRGLGGAGLLGVALHYIQTGGDYIVAAFLVALGVYVLLYWQSRFVRIIGAMLLGSGIGWGCFAYGRSVGGEAIMNAWRAADKQARIEAAERDISMARLAKSLAEQYTVELSKENSELRKQVKDYEDAVKNSPAGRRATADDIKRLCQLTGGKAPACRKGAK